MEPKLAWELGKDQLRLSHNPKIASAAAQPLNSPCISASHEKTRLRSGASHLSLAKIEQVERLWKLLAQAKHCDSIHDLTDTISKRGAANIRDRVPRYFLWTQRQITNGMRWFEVLKISF